MNYTVIWLESAMSTLWELWLNSPDQNAITFASETLQMRLSHDPYSEGESREGMEDRIAFEFPLQILFRVINEHHRVQISHIRGFNRLKQ